MMPRSRQFLLLLGQIPAVLVATPPRGEGFFGGGNGLSIRGLPIVKPPYGVLSAIDMDKGELKWR